MSNMINPIELTSELIRCESITPKSAGSIDLIISLLEPLDLVVKKLILEKVLKKLKIYMQDLVSQSLTFVLVDM